MTVRSTKLDILKGIVGATVSKMAEVDKYMLTVRDYEQIEKLDKAFEEFIDYADEQIKKELEE